MAKWISSDHRYETCFGLCIPEEQDIEVWAAEIMKLVNESVQ